MRLKAFRVRNYKTISDGGWVEVDPNVTCLMGKNESGKSALMQAIWKFNNAAGVTYDPLFDLPAQDFTTLRQTDPEVVALTFSLEPSDVAAFAERFTGHLPTPATFTVRSTYAKKRAIDVDLGPQATTTFDVIASALSELQQAIDRDAAEMTDAAEKARLSTAGQALSALVVAAAPAKLATEVPTARVEAAHDALLALQGSATVTAAVPQVLAFLDTFARESQRPKVRSEAEAWLLEHLPIFIYFDDYGRLHTRINLRAFVSSLSNPPSDRESRTLHRTQLALFEWANLDARELLRLGEPKQGSETQDQVERRKAERDRILESAGYQLSGDWVDWWDQRVHELVIGADGEDLELRVRDNVNPWKIPFGERSRGFQWFFSFYLTFLVESGKEHRGAVILLDEPGLHLHMTAQLKLLKFFQRVAVKNQLLYSSHSPFMVDPDRVDNVRTVFLNPVDPSDPKSRAYTRVSGNCEPEGDRDTLLPLQAAGAYQLAQTIFLGKRTLVVEGITDYWLLRTLSGISRERGGVALDDDTVIVWAGGTAHLLPLASIMSAREQMGPNRMAVLLDSDQAGRQKARDLVGLLLRGEDAILLLGDILGIAVAEAEDLVEPDELLAGLRKLGRTVPTDAAPLSGETNVPFLRRLYGENGWGALSVAEKARVVLALVDLWRGGAASPSAGTLGRAWRVFMAVNERFVKLGSQPRASEDSL